MTEVCWTTNIYLFVSANEYNGDNKEQDEDHNSTAYGNTKPDVHWSFFCETIYWQCYTFYCTCITLFIFPSLLLPIFNDSAAYVSIVPFLRKSSHFHWPLCCILTSGMDIKCWGLEGGQAGGGHLHFTVRLEAIECPNVHVRFTLWPTYTREPPEELTSRRRSEQS